MMNSITEYGMLNTRTKFHGKTLHTYRTRTGTVPRSVYTVSTVYVLADGLQRVAS